MKKSHRTILMVVVGLAIVVVVVGGGGLAWFFMSAFESSSSDEATAIRSIEEVRRQFKGVRPLIEISQPEKEATGVAWSGELTAKAPATPARAIERVRALAWDAEDATLTTFTLPWWLIQMTSDPIDLEIGETGKKLRLTPEDIEKYGPALVVDHTEPDGSRVIVWTD